MRYLVFFMIFAFLSPSEAISGSDEKFRIEREIIKKGKKLEDVEKRLRETNEAISRISRKETTILEEVERLNRTLNSQREEIISIDRTIETLEGEISSTDEKMTALEKEKVSLSGHLKGRLRAMYKVKRGGMVKLLFSIDDSADITTKYKYMALIMDYDRMLMERAEKNIKELEGAKVRLKGLMEELYSQKESLEFKRKETADTLKGRNIFFSAIKKEKIAHVKLAKELEDSKNSLFEIIDRLEKEGKGFGESQKDGSSGFSAMKGRLNLPVDGKIVSFYGKMLHPRFNTVTFNNGIIIEAPFGAEVKSVYRGRVAYNGWLRGYGEVVIVDHGEDFYTLFGYLSKILREKGSEVEKGDVLGLVGDSGTHGMPALYFEIREKAVPRDPAAWMVQKKGYR